VILVWLIYTGQTRKMLALPWLRGLALFCALVLPWFVLGQGKYPELFNYLIIGQHFARYTGQSFNNQWPFWFYLAVLPLLLFPWSLLLVSWIRTSTWRSLALHDRQAPSSRWPSLLWIWLFVILLFFSLPKSKIVGYIFVVLPPTAAILARTWGMWQANEARKFKVFRAALVISLALAGVANWAAGEHALKKHSSKDVAILLGCAVLPGEPVYAAGAYPYDLPFYAQLHQPMIVVEDWSEARRNSGDNWRRELFEAADFEPALGSALLQPPTALQKAPANAWLVTPSDSVPFDQQIFWRKAYQGRVWALWLKSSTTESPPASQQERLSRCHKQSQH